MILYPCPKCGNNLPGAYIGGENLQGANIWGANLRDSNLQGSNLKKTDLRKANLQRAQLQGTSFRGADLRGTDFRESDLRGAILIDVDLREADLRGANLRGSNLLGANLRGANLRGAYILDVIWPDPEIVLLASWGTLSDNLTKLGMALDRSNHPNPEVLERWANGTDPCPYFQGYSAVRTFNFIENKHLYDHNLPAPTLTQTMQMVLEECCNS